MSGGFDPNNPPIRRGFYNNVVAAAQAAVSGGSRGTLALPITGPWGPIATFESVTSQSGYDALFSNTDNDQRFAAIGALTGSGASSKSGVSEVLAYRLPLSGQAQASHVFQNTTPAAAVTITGKYKGTLGNSIAITVQAHPTDGTKDQVLVYLNSQLVETWSYTTTSLAGLASQVNNATTGSKYITVTVTQDGVALTLVSSISLTGGLDGAAIASDYTAAMVAFESQDFNLFAIPNLSDAPTLAAAQSWVETINSSQQRVLMVEGGSSSEALSDAIARAAETNDNPNFVTAGYNQFTQTSTGNTKTTAQMVGYLAGMIAEAGITSSITFMRGPAGFTLNFNPSPSDIESAITGGVVIFSTDSEGIKAENENTTFTDNADITAPVNDYKSIKAVRTIHQIDTDITKLTNDNWIGKVANTSQTRNNYLGTLLAYFRGLEGSTALQQGTSLLTLDDTKDNTGDTLWPLYTITMTDTIQRVLATGQIAA